MPFATVGDCIYEKIIMQNNIKLLSTVLLAATLIFLFMFYNREEVPFRDLQASQVANVSIYSLSNTQQADLSADEFQI